MRRVLVEDIHVKLTDYTIKKMDLVCAVNASEPSPERLNTSILGQLIDFDLGILILTTLEMLRDLEVLFNLVKQVATFDSVNYLILNIDKTWTLF